jgi:hypothetical protein
MKYKAIKNSCGSTFAWRPCFVYRCTSGSRRRSALNSVVTAHARRRRQALQLVRDDRRTVYIHMVSYRAKRVQTQQAVMLML